LNSYKSLSLFSHRELNVLLLCLHLYIICSMTWLWYRCDYAYERNYFHVWLIYTANACSAIYWQTLYWIVVYFVFASMRFNSRFIHQFYIKVCCVQLHMCFDYCLCCLFELNFEWDSLFNRKVLTFWKLSLINKFKTRTIARNGLFESSISQLFGQNYYYFAFVSHLYFSLIMIWKCYSKFDKSNSFWH